MVTPCIWLGTTYVHASMQPTPICWSVGKFPFLHDLYIWYVYNKYCFLPVLLVFVMKCWIKMLCSLPHNNHYIAACFLHLCACLTYSPVHASILHQDHCLPTRSSVLLCWCLHPLLAHLHLCYVDVYLLFVFFLSVLKFSLVWLFCFCHLRHFLLLMLVCIHSTCLLLFYWP